MQEADPSVVFHVFSFIYTNTSTTPSPLSLSPFSVCRRWREVLTAPSPFWKNLFHTRFPKFFTPLSPSKKRSIDPATVDYRNLFIALCAMIQVDVSSYNAKINKQEELENQFLEQNIPHHMARYRRELVESVAFRLFSNRFPQFVPCNHLLYGPVGCGKATLIKSLARLWGSNLMVIQYPLLVLLESRLGWSGFVDYVCNYVLSFSKSHTPTIIHLHNLSNNGSARAQQTIAQFLDTIPRANIWVIGTTTNPNNMNPTHAHSLSTKLYVPFPNAAERETFLKFKLLPHTCPSPSLSSPSLAPRTCARLSSPFAPPHDACVHLGFSPVSLESIHLLALRTHDYTYADLKVLCQQLLTAGAATRGEGIPFVKLMDVLSKIMPIYKSEDAKKFDDFDPTTIVLTPTSTWVPNFGIGNWVQVE